MKLRMGQIFRNPEGQHSDVEEVDGLPNYYFYTKVKNHKAFINQKGIHLAEKVKTVNGENRRPVIIAFSNPNNAGTEYTPWKDYFDTDHGYIKYYGDNKEGNLNPNEKQGNKSLLELVSKYQSEDREIRKKEAVPIVFFERIKHNNKKSGYLKFQGFGIIDNVKLVTQALNGKEFANYVFEFNVFSLTDENEEFNWDWIAKRCDINLSTEETNKYAPNSWKKWVETGRSDLSRRNVIKLSVVKKENQMPKKNSKEDIILKKVRTFYEKKKHKFEGLAMECLKFFLKESNIRYTDGWITKKSGDGGVDFVLKINIGSGFEGLDIVVLGQAKCEAETKHTRGLDVARTVARLRRGWIGAYVTTSYFSEQMQEEIIEDKYPIIKINGLKLAELIDRNVLDGTNEYKKLDDYLEMLEVEYEKKISYRKPEEILL